MNTISVDSETDTLAEADPDPERRTGAANAAGASEARARKVAREANISKEGARSGGRWNEEKWKGRGGVKREVVDDEKTRRLLVQLL